jgi:dephospho-CoA kinase
MYVLVLTGGLGAGKSTAARFFQQHDASVVDLDEVARHVLTVGSPVVGQLVDEFGPGIVLPDGSVDREYLASLAFESPDSVARLNSIVHPAIAREVGPALDELRSMSHQPSAVVLEVPLLVEAPVFAELADEVLAITAPLEQRVARAAAKGIPADEARRRIALQADDDARAALAAHVIANDGDIDAFLGRLQEFWNARFAQDGVGSASE